MKIVRPIVGCRVYNVERCIVIRIYGIANTRYLIYKIKCVSNESVET